MTRTEAMNKAARYCAYQERYQQEVRDKLYSYGLHSEDVENILTDLITEGFINEERYAVAYAGGKFRIKQWGRVKIEYELTRRGLSAYCIRKGLGAIDQDSYRQTLIKLLIQKKQAFPSLPPLLVKNKVFQYLFRKGYEQSLITEIWEEYGLNV